MPISECRHAPLRSFRGMEEPYLSQAVLKFKVWASTEQGVARAPKTQLQPVLASETIISTSNVLYNYVCLTLSRNPIQDCLLVREVLAQPSKKSLVRPRPSATMTTWCNSPTKGDLLRSERVSQGLKGAKIIGHCEQDGRCCMRQRAAASALTGPKVFSFTVQQAAERQPWYIVSHSSMAS